MNKLKKFREMGLSENIIKVLARKGFEEPTPIQEQTIPLLLEGNKDLVGQAQTGTGKTAAFGIPLVERIEDSTPRIEALILTPTRELALQVSDEINSLRGKKKITILPVYGGQNIEIQIRNLAKGDVNIVVGTPGRILDHLSRKTLDLSGLRFMILDEADEMLNMGFIEDVQKILKQTPPVKQMLLFSATMPDEIISIAKKHMKDYQVVRIKTGNATVELTDQIYFEVNERDKFEALCRILDIENEFYGIIFCRTKLYVDDIAGRLAERGYAAEAIHGDISQAQREKVLGRFRNRKINILIATDVAARGIDVTDLTHVINYSLPQCPDSYVHRIGRTGRAGKEGTAITFVTRSELQKLLHIQKSAGTDIRKQEIPEVPEVIAAKKSRIKDEILSIISTEGFDDYIPFAEELLGYGKKTDIVASILKYALEDELDERNYQEIRRVNVNKAGKARLFVALGKSRKMTPPKLLELIKEKVNIDTKKIREIQIFENFSFLTAPFEEAEIILDAFKSFKGGRKPIIERAKPFHK